MNSKKAQVSVTFNWIYILIAGGIILLFFVGIIVKQKSISEDKLSSDVLNSLESIFTSAGVSEKTRNYVDMGGLAEQELYFECEEGVTEYGIEGKGVRIQNAMDPIFAPKNIKAPRMILWSLPYKMPFRVMNFLFVSSSNTKYSLLGTDQFVIEFLNATDDRDPQLRINRELVSSLDEIDPGKNYHLRVVDFDGLNIPGKPIPETLANLNDEKISAVVFNGLDVSYYAKEGNKWVKEGETVTLVSLSGERQAAKYAAIFSGDGSSYMCNIKKALKRLSYLDEIYLAKMAEMKEVYAPQHPCYLQLIGDKSVDTSLDIHSVAVGLCQTGSCKKLVEAANDLRLANNQLRLASCISLY
jgi:hypothetical protein